MPSALGVPIGFGAGTGLTGVDQVREQAQWAARSGLTSFWVSQILGVDPIVALAAVAADVPDPREVGTSVVPLAGRHPLALAAQARTAQNALGGRFTLGVGPSHAMVTEGFYGEPYDRSFSRTVEFLAALVPLLRGESADVVGEQFETHGWLTIDAEPVPLLLAALGPPMLDPPVGWPTGRRSGRAARPRSPGTSARRSGPRRPQPGDPSPGSRPWWPSP